MKRLFRTLSALCLVVCMMVVSMVPVQASVRSSEFIDSYDVYISNIGDGELQIRAELSTLPDCEELEIVYVELYEQNGSDWDCVAFWTTSVENDNFLALTRYYDGEIGKRYVAEAEFRVKNNNIEETRTKTSLTLVCR